MTPQKEQDELQAAIKLAKRTLMGHGSAMVEDCVPCRVARALLSLASKKEESQKEAGNERSAV